MKTLNLYIAYYSKTKTIAKAIENLKNYPEQAVNTPAALQYSMEFRIQTHTNGAVGTLSEYSQDADEFVLHFADGSIEVKKDGEKFVVKQDIHEKYLDLLEDALLDILDGTSAGDLQSMTGIKFERAVEIVSLFGIITEKRKTI